jgi:hypothetical protein
VKRNVSTEAKSKITSDSSNVTYETDMNYVFDIDMVIIQSQFWNSSELCKCGTKTGSMWYNCFDLLQNVDVYNIDNHIYF